MSIAPPAPQRIVPGRDRASRCRGAACCAQVPYLLAYRRDAACCPQALSGAAERRAAARCALVLYHSVDRGGAARRHLASSGVMPRLTPDLVLTAYCQGLFPMARSRRGPIEWFRPDPRAIFDPQRVHLSRPAAAHGAQWTLRRTDQRRLRGHHRGVRRPRRDLDLAEVERVYAALQARGFAHSVEAYQDGTLVGGLYGVAIGGAFMGESMFHYATDASKVCFAHLVERMRERGFVLLDTQFMTEHLASLGAYYVSRRRVRPSAGTRAAARLSVRLRLA